MTGSHGTAADIDWWRHAVIYQVYVRSFADADGDGVGDLAGMRAHLDYVARLGADAVWLSPICPSGGVDGGYDVVDYCDVDPEYGTLAAFDALVSDAHARGLRVIVDVVPNHSSARHPRFTAALAAGPGAPERDWYHFRPGRGEDGMLPPTNWWGTDRGSAWTLVHDSAGEPERDADGLAQWYLHLFDRGQPDWNWAHPGVAAMFDDVLRFWLGRGVDGFRVDVAHGLVKTPGLPDWHPPAERRAVDGGMVMHTADPRHRPPMWDQDGNRAVFARWRGVLDTWRRTHGGPERVLVGEAWVEHARVREYVAPGRLHQVFDPAFLAAGWAAAPLRAAVDDALTAFASVGTGPCWVLSNHDVIRAATRFGYPAGTTLPYGIGAHDPQPDTALGRRRARAAVALMLALPGAAVLYQGDELALPEVTDLPDDARRDPVWRSSGGADRGRDGCRVPLPWTHAGPSHGFGPGAALWLPQPQGWGRYAVDVQNGDDRSALAMTRRALALRWDHGLGRGTVRWRDVPDGVLCFDTADVRVVANTTDDAVCVPVDGFARVLLASSAAQEGGDDIRVPADTTVWLL